MIEFPHGFLLTVSVMKQLFIFLSLFIFLFPHRIYTAFNNFLVNFISFHLTSEKM